MVRQPLLREDPAAEFVLLVPATPIGLLEAVGVRAALRSRWPVCALDGLGHFSRKSAPD